MQRKASTEEIIPSLYEVDSAASLDRPQVTYPVDRPEPTPMKMMSLIRALSVATILPFAKLGEELLRTPRGYGVVVQSPYITLLEDEYEEGVFTPILAFSLGGPHIVVPRRVTLSKEALRALAIGRVIMNPIVVDFQEQAEPDRAMYLPDGQCDPNRIYQGDIFEETPCFFLPSTDFQFLREDGHVYAEPDLPQGWKNEELLIVRARKFKIILLSQTCDIHEESKRNLHLDEDEVYANQLILYSPVIPLTDLGNYKKQRDSAKDRRQRENQNISGAFFLPAHPDGQRFPDSIVYLPWVCSLTKKKANRFSTFDPKKRLASLASPFREAFASKFGQAIERVALPTGAFTALFTDNKPGTETHHGG